MHLCNVSAIFASFIVLCIFFRRNSKIKSERGKKARKHDKTKKKAPEPKLETFFKDSNR